MFLSVDGGRSRIYSSDTSQGGHRRRFLALMVGALRSTALTPPKELAIDVFTFMVGATGSPSAPPREPVVDVS
jgi:hypothetical protein